MRQSSGEKFISHTNECIFICAPSTMIFFPAAASRSIFIFSSECVWGWFGGQQLSSSSSTLVLLLSSHTHQSMNMWKLSYCYVCGEASFFFVGFLLEELA